MKTSLVVSIVLFAVFAIPEINCSSGECVEFNGRCLIDSDCCSDNCHFSGNPHNRYCKEPKNEVPDYKIESVMCLYNKSFSNENASSTAYDLFGVHASHSLLPPYTKVQLNYNNKTIDVTIDDIKNTTNGTTLGLSREAADILGIKDGELVPCSIGIYEPEPNYSPVKKIIGFTTSFFIIFLVLLYAF